MVEALYWRGILLLTALFAASGCGLLLDLGPPPEGVDPGSDAGGPSDGGIVDAKPTEDSTSSDALGDPTPDGVATGPDVIAHDCDGIVEASITFGIPLYAVGFDLAVSGDRAMVVYSSGARVTQKLFQIAPSDPVIGFAGESSFAGVGFTLGPPQVAGARGGLFTVGVQDDAGTLFVFDPEESEEELPWPTENVRAFTVSDETPDHRTLVAVIARPEIELQLEVLDESSGMVIRETMLEGVDRVDALAISSRAAAEYELVMRSTGVAGSRLVRSRLVSGTLDPEEAVSLDGTVGVLRPSRPLDIVALGPNLAWVGHNQNPGSVVGAHYFTGPGGPWPDVSTPSCPASGRCSSMRAISGASGSDSESQFALAAVVPGGGPVSVHRIANNRDLGGVSVGSSSNIEVSLVEIPARVGGYTHLLGVRNGAESHVTAFCLPAGVPDP